MSSSVTSVELVIARQLNTWLAASLQTARLYAEGLVNGAVAVVADANDWRRVPAAVGHAVDEEHEVPGFRWALNAEEWQVGIGSIHGLAHGVIECVETGTRYGVETDLHVAWFIYPEDLEDTDLTLEDLAAAFDGNVLAAASAFLRACDAMPAGESPSPSNLRVWRAAVQRPDARAGDTGHRTRSLAPGGDWAGFGAWPAVQRGRGSGP